MANITVHHGDSREVLKTIPDNSVDSVVTDPPYALVSIGKRFGKAGAAPAKGDVYARASSGFMGQQWDTGEVAFDPAFWAEVLRVLKPGGHVAAFGGTRTYGRLQVAIEDGGFEVRDSVIELVATDTRALAFLNSLNDEQRQAFVRMLDEREGGLLGWVYGSGFRKSTDFAAVPGSKRTGRITRPELVDTPFADGWGTGLKPAIEPIVLARKPLGGRVAANVMKWGTGGLNIDGCRIDAVDKAVFPVGATSADGVIKTGLHSSPRGEDSAPFGRWPANVVHDGSSEVAAAFPDTASGALNASVIRGSENKVYGKGMAPAGVAATARDIPASSGSASRFFYSAKADAEGRLGSKHPTVKPVDLMRWLCTLITPPAGTVLDPFAGSGSTGLGAMVAGFDAILIEREAAFVEDINRRVAWARGRGGVTNELIRKGRPAPTATGLLSLLGD